MTCIAGLVDKDGVVWMGADSAGVAGDRTIKRKDSKIFKNGELLFGFTSSFRMGQLLRYSFDPPKHYDDIDIDSYIHKHLIPAIRECFSMGGYKETINGRESGGTFLVGYRSRLFIVFDDFQVGEALNGYCSVGSGEEVALGSLFTSSNLQISSSAKVLIALEAAAEYNTYVSGPFTVMSLESEGE